MNDSLELASRSLALWTKSVSESLRKIFDSFTFIAPDFSRALQKLSEVAKALEIEAPQAYPKYSRRSNPVKLSNLQRRKYTLKGPRI